MHCCDLTLLCSWHPGNHLTIMWRYKDNQCYLAWLLSLCMPYTNRYDFIMCKVNGCKCFYLLKCPVTFGLFVLKCVTDFYKETFPVVRKQ